MRANVVSFVLAVAGLVIFALLASSAPAASTGGPVGATGPGLSTASARSKAGSDPPGPVKADGKFCGALAAVSSALNKTATAATAKTRGSALGHLESEVTRLVSLAPSAKTASDARDVEHAYAALYDAESAARSANDHPYSRGRSLLADMSTFHGLLTRFEADLCAAGSGN